MHQRPVFLFLLFLLVFPRTSSGQSDTASNPSGGMVPSLGEVVLDDGMSFLRAAGFVFTGPLRWEGGDWAKLGGMALSTGTAALLDDEMYDLMRRNRYTPGDRLERATVWYGVDLNILLFSGGVYTIGLLTRDDWIRETGFLVGTSMVLSGAVSGMIKGITGRGRPYLGRGNDFFRPFMIWENDYHAFPSGHTIVAFSASTVLARRIGNPWATVGLYALATGTALSRTYSRNHWLSDIVFAGFLSTFISNSIVSWYERGETMSAPVGWNIIPGPRGVALVLYL